MQTAGDVVQVRARDEYFLQLGLRKTAEGEWTAVTRGVDGNLLAGLDTKDIKMATTIAQMMKNMSLITEKYNPAAQARIAAEVAGLLGPNATQEDILNAIRSVIGRFDTEQIGIGGESIPAEQSAAARKVLAMTNAQIYTEAMKWYNPQRSVLSTALPIRQDTIVGKMMAGAADRIWMEQNMEKKYEIIQMVHRLTDIPVQRLIDDRNHSTDATAYASKMMNLLQDAQYSDVLESAAPRPNPAFLTAKPDLPSYNGNRDVRIRFDIATAGKEFQRVVAYIDGMQVTGARNTAFINIPMTSFHQSRSNVQVQLRAFFADGSTADTWSDSFDVAPTSIPVINGEILHLSASDDPIENAILTQVANNFPLSNPSRWHQTFGSGFHSEHAYNAIDLNMDAQDAGEIIRVVADGIITGIGRYGINQDGASFINVLHTSNITVNGQVIQQQWISKYLHMPMQKQLDANGNEVFIMNYNGGSVTLALNMHLTAKDIIGGVGDFGSPGAFHSHQEYIKGSNPSGVALDIGKTLDFLNIDSKAFIPGEGERVLTWVNNEWIYGNKELVYKRNIDGTEHFFANTVNREEVRYDSDTNEWYEWHNATNRFAENSTGAKRKWIPFSSTKWSY